MRFWQSELRSRNGRYKQDACRIWRCRQWEYNNFRLGKCLLAKAGFVSNILRIYENQMKAKYYQPKT
jgi:hypothetical protein